MIALLPLLLTLVVPQDDPGDGARPPLGRFLNQIDEIETSAGLALDDEGVLWVLEEFPGRLLRVTPDGSREVLASGLHAPLDVERAADGSLYVSEAAGFGIAHLSATGELLGRIGKDRLQRAAGLTLGTGELLVTDSERNRVEVFALDGEHLRGFGSHGLGQGQLIAPADLALDVAGNIYVADRGNSRVQVFDSAGAFLRAWGDWGPFPGLFHEPSGIEVRGDEVFVADFGNHRVQVFSLQGELRDRFGLHAIRPREGHGNVHYPAALALSPNGEFAALAEPWVDRVQIFCRSGGTAEDAVRRQASQLAKPSAHYGMHLATGGPYLFISEPESHSVLVYENTDAEPRRIGRLGGLGNKTGLLTGVAGMHFDRKTRDLWVCDPILRRLSLFRMRGSEQDEVGFDARLGSFVKSVDLARLHALELHELLAEVPEVVAIERDASGRFYLADRRNGAVIVLSPALEVLRVLGADVLEAPLAVAVTRAGDAVFVVDAAGPLWRFDGAASEPRKLAELPAPFGLVLHEAPAGEEGTLEVFVSDAHTHRVLCFDGDGKQLREWGGKGLLRGEFYKPRGLAIDQRGHLLVLDHGNHRLVRFTRAGEYQSIFGPRLYTRLARYPEFANQEEDE